MVTTLALAALLLSPGSEPPPAVTPPTPPAAPEAPAPPKAPTIVEKLQSEAQSLSTVVTSALAKSFLEQTRALPLPAARKVYRTKDRARAISEAAFGALPDAEKEAFTVRECPPEFYYTTGYGSPLVYARVLDVLSLHGVRELTGRTLMDFGYGSIGQLRLMAHMGCAVRGVEVEPMFEALYSAPGDVGPIGAGSIALHTGRWPAEEAITKGVGAGFDVITSKNTLKAGYIHPAREVDERFLVKLGVSDEEFLKAIQKSLKPGGLFVIYNICPAQNPDDKPYLPHADGKSPFTRKQFETAGLLVLALDVDDQPKVLEVWKALGYDGGKPPEEAKKETFAWYTVVQRSAP